MIISSQMDGNEVIFMNSCAVYSETELYPQTIANILQEAGMLLADESSMFEDYLRHTQSQEVDSL